MKLRLTRTTARSIILMGLDHSEKAFVPGRDAKTRTEARAYMRAAYDAAVSSLARMYEISPREVRKITGAMLRSAQDDFIAYVGAELDGGAR